MHAGARRHLSSGAGAALSLTVQLRLQRRRVTCDIHLGADVPVDGRAGCRQSSNAGMCASLKQVNLTGGADVKAN